MDYLEFIARVTSHIPDKGQVMVRYYGLYSNAHRGKIRKNMASPSHPPIIEQEEPFRPSKGWAEMIRKVYEVDPLLCPTCGGQMRIISFIEEPSITNNIIAHLKLTFEAERPPPPHNVQQELLMAAEERGEYAEDYYMGNLALFVSQAVDRIGPSCFHCLEAHCQHCDCKHCYRR